MDFAQRLLAWQRRHGRRGLPWQGTRDPYRIWLSEIMLQQTQVATVVPYYRRFLERFADVQALARAREEQVLELWSGLGYYARARHLHQAAKRIAAGGFPRTAAAMADLPGVGRSTAAAVAVFAYGERAAILDANARRVLARCFAAAAEKDLWALAEKLVPERGVERYTQALMDLGATVCTRGEPACERCPMSVLCCARKEGRIADFPPRRARAPLPEREVTWLVLRQRDRVLLERRPAPGVWGGLWCFPELAGKPPRRYFNGEWRVERAQPLPVVEHGFTHFRLCARPLLYEVRRAPPLAPRRRWLALGAVEGAALPSPVRTLLGRLCREAN